MGDGFIHNEECGWHEQLSDEFMAMEWLMFIEEGGEVNCFIRWEEDPDIIHGTPNIYNIPEQYFGESLIPASVN